MSGTDPVCEWLGTHRYARRKPPAETLEQKMRKFWPEVGLLLVLWTLTWFVVLVMLRMAVHGLITFDLLLSVVLVVVLGGHFIHMARMVRMGFKRLADQRRDWLEADPDAHGVPATLTCFRHGFGSGRAGLVAVEGSALVFRCPRFTAVLQPRDLVEAQPSGRLLFSDPGFDRRISIRFGGTGREGWVKSKVALAQVTPELEKWRSVYAEGESVFPPVRRNPIGLPARTLTLHLPLLLLSMLAAVSLIDLMSKVIFPGAHMLSPADYLTNLGVLVGFYVAAVLGMRLWERSIAVHNRKLDAMSQVEVPIRSDSLAEVRVR